MRTSLGNGTGSLVVGALLAMGAGCGDSAPLPPIPLERQWLDLAYAPGSSAQRLDLYLPPEGDGPFPLLVWIHGGGWRNGDKALGPNAFQRQVLLRGFALASVNYRLSGEASFPAQIHDVKTAIRWLREHGRNHRLRTRRIGAWGSSAGGHLVSLLGTSGDVAPLEGSHLGNRERSSRVQAVVDWFGPADLVGFLQDLVAGGCPTGLATGPESTLGLFLGASPQERPDLAAAASPITYVSADDPPFLIQHGEADCVVPVAQSQRLHEEIAGVGGPGASSVSLFPEGHGGALFRTEGNLTAILDFFEAHIY